jgi:hypothetical protein
MALFPLGILSAAGAGGVAGPAYELIQTYVLDSSQASVTFSSLGDYSSTYKHLQIRMVGKGSGSGAELLTLMTFNGDTANYISHQLYGYNGSVASGAVTGTPTRAMIGYTANANVTSAFGSIVVDILDPYSTTKNTTSRALSGNAGGTGVNAIVNLQSHLFLLTNAVASTTISPLSGSFIAGSRFSLYGITG